MPQPDIPQFHFADGYDLPGTDTFTNVAIPRMGGYSAPGSDVFIRWGDTAPQKISVDDDGIWDYTVPELADGDHDFVLWSENPATGERSESIEWEHAVSADEEARAFQRHQAQQWHQGGSREWRQQRRDAIHGLKGQAEAERRSGGGGGGSSGGGGGGGGSQLQGTDAAAGGGYKPTDPEGSGGGGGASRSGATRERGRGDEGGDDGGSGGGDGAQWLEKGNAPG